MNKNLLPVNKFMLQTEEKIKRNDIELFAFPFHIILLEELGGGCDKAQGISFLYYSEDILKGHNQKRE